ncbi:hypothetical protein XI02_42200 [Bradyrhizobium sp. CCBAU 21365]|uniref:hypothetical protein n=1 Tax=Bradyrhizobium sp. CCBAU 21365 TaxID=1325083 RepID=UPI00188B9216|nr:hypothetical protein [Bradyrhizobium sp. CCBAU 21365]QOZ20831.1 hypothetical protein XI02_42200 [Bradyrhizobium sp. CCBAU 21365]
MISEEVLSQPPSDPERPENYTKLYELWKEARGVVDFVATDEEKFGDWDLRVQSLLDPAEREFYLSPYDGLDLRYLDYRSVSRMNHLTKILLNRQGINAHGSR